MPADAGNIFLTYENLAFSLPLLILCGSYAYFTYLPPKVSLSGVALALIVYQIQAQIKARKDEKLTNLDESTILEIVGEEDAKDAAKAAEARKNAQKAKNRVKSRLAHEKKKKGNAKDDDDDVDVAAIAKKSNEKKKKK